MRKVRCFIKNGGTGLVELIDDHLSHGEWADNQSPTQSASVINPGEEKMFRAEQGGDIPLIGSFATGTEGWALYRTRIPDNEKGGTMECFIRITWNLPYLAFSSEGVGAWVNAYRYDPRQVYGPGMFDDRDKRPPPIELLQGGGSEPTGGDRFVFLIPQAYPWMLTFYPMVLAESDTFIVVALFVKNTVEPASTTLPPPPPFTNTKSVTPVPAPLTGSAPKSWCGIWRSEHVVVRISDAGGGLLDVTVTETMLGETVEQPVQRVGISRLVFKTGIPALLEGGTISGMAPPNPLSRLRLEEHVLVGSRQAKVNPIVQTTPHFVSVVKNNPSIIATMMDDKHQIGGDYIKLSPDTVIEIYKMVASGTVVDLALRYRRPGVQGMMTLARIDEMLRYELQIY